MTDFKDYDYTLIKTLTEVHSGTSMARSPEELAMVLKGDPQTYIVEGHPSDVEIKILSIEESEWESE
jgi:hypothetical protein